MPFDGIGLDFLEGKETLQLIESYGFPKERNFLRDLLMEKYLEKSL